MKQFWAVLACGILCVSASSHGVGTRQALQKLPQEELATVVATNLWIHPCHHVPERAAQLIDGIRLAMAGEPLPEGCDGHTQIQYEEALWQNRRAKNYSASTELVGGLDPTYEVVPQYLFRETLQTGEGAALPPCYGRVKLSYHIEVVASTAAPDSPYLDAVDKEQDAWVSIEDLLPGFALGLFGMQIGERVKLWIHPALGYGPEALFEPGATLVAEVQLLDFEEMGQAYPPFSMLIQPCPDVVNQQELDRLDYLAGLYEGYRLWPGLDKSRMCSTLSRYSSV